MAAPSFINIIALHSRRLRTVRLACGPSCRCSRSAEAGGRGEALTYEASYLEPTSRMIITALAMPL